MRYQFMRFPDGKAKAVTFSYDDGRKSDIRFSDILEKYGLKCTFNMHGATLRNENSHLTYNEMQKYILDRGHEIAVHGYNHRASGTLRPIEGIRDVLENRIELERELDTIIRGMAYPDSGIKNFINPDYSYNKVKNYLTELDIAYSRTLGGDNSNFFLPEDWYAWMPTAHHDNKNILTWIDEFLELDLSDKSYVAYRRPRLFYIWGHTYEFDRKNNWEHAEEICKKLGGHDDIWYATNMEIYEYTEAYNSLIYSADGTKIYNPTLKTVWIDIDKKVYEIKSGETIKI